VSLRPRIVPVPSAAPLAATASGGGAVPRHVAIIMDGNGRWAKARRLPRIAGHRQGIEAVRRTVEAAPTLGIEVLTLFAFSTENAKRPEDEVNDLMGLLRHYLRSEIGTLHKNNVRLRFIGEYRRLNPDLVELLESSAERTRLNTGLTLVIALNYGAQDEIVRAMQSIAADVAAGRLDATTIDAALIDKRLDTADLPPPDLVIRTSGEQRLSNFLLWQAAYAELVFTDQLWPDFDTASLEAALAEFATRDRRYGGI
jgi:undecaprenyl diphosphate synthase